MHTRSITGLLALAAVLCLTPIASAAEPAAGSVIPGRWIVTLKADAGPVAEADAVGASPIAVYRHAVRGFAADLTSAQVARLRSDPDVARIEPDRVVRADVVQSGATWGLDRIDQRNRPLSGTYAYEMTGAGVTAYVIDTGVRATHEELRGRVGTGYTAISDGNGTSDCNGHGTHVAGTIGGTRYGVAKSVTIIPVRVLDCRGSGSISGVVAGVDFVVGHHVGTDPAVANMSLGGGASTTLDDAVRRGIADGVVFAVAAGNSTADACGSSPSRVTEALTVGATASDDTRASYSNYGSCLDLFAPGSSITSSWSTSDTAINTISGTSMATPHVAGVAALLLQAEPAAAPTTIMSRLVGRATPGLVVDARTGSPNLLLYASPIAATAPLALSAVPSASSVSLSWTAPTDNGGAPITDYVIDQQTAGGAWTRVSDPVSTSTTASISGLAAGTTYGYRVAAVTAAGAGAWSSTVSATTSGTSAPVVTTTAPSAPQSVTLERGDRTLTVRWALPASDGGSAIKGYTVTASPGGAVCTTSTLSCALTGLINGTSYTVTVTAWNDVGTGPASAGVSATPATVPSAPLNVTATAGNGRLTVRWSAPADGGSPITGYRASASPGTSSCSVAATTFTCDLGSLKNGTTYTVSVTATNAVGTSPAATVQATPSSKVAVKSQIAVRSATRSARSVRLSFNGIPGTLYVVSRGGRVLARTTSTSISVATTGARREVLRVRATAPDGAITVLHRVVVTRTGATIAA